MDFRKNVEVRNAVAIAFLCLFFNSCTKESKAITMNVETKKLVSYDSEKIKNIFIGEEPYLSEARNVIDIVLSNSTDKKYIFLLSKNDISNFKNSWSLDILDSNGHSVKAVKKSSSNPGNPKDFNDLKSVYYLEGVRSEFEYEISKIKGFVSDADSLFGYKLASNYFVLYPGQVKRFRLSVHLPITLPYSGRDYYQIDKGKSYFGQLYLKVGQVDLASLPPFLVKEIEENNYEIFTGTIASQKIPIECY